MDDDVAPTETTPALDEPIVHAFAELGLRSELIEALIGLGYEEPTPIQREAIPHLLAGRDLLGQAATGTGKTAAFALPALDRVTSGPAGDPQVLILVPTRELCIQVAEAMYRYGQRLKAQVVAIYGGQHIGRQLDALRRGTQIVVATPGRALDHIGRGTLRLGSVSMVVLDEADEMLDMGFAEDLEAILQATPSERQTVLFSATLPPRINSIARNHLREPVRVEIKRISTDAEGTPLVRQRAYIVPRFHKAAALGRILDIEEPAATIVFCRTRGEVDELTDRLNARGYRAEALHGGMVQEQRDRVMSHLRSGATELLVATDVAARGLDVDALTHVVNYEVPSAPEAYVHRIGRVGRAGREGVAITLAEPRERRLLENIERLTKQKISIEKIPSVADLRARQLDQTRSALRAATADTEELERFRDLYAGLSAELDPTIVALAAVRLAHEASGASLDEVEIPDFAAKLDRPERSRDQREQQRGDQRPRRVGTDGRAAPTGRPGGKGQWSERVRSSAEARTGRIYVNVGRSSGTEPRDLVGAIANETSLVGSDIGAIRVGDHYSVVEIPEAAIDDVIAAMKRTTIRGKQAKVRRFTD